LLATCSRTRALCNAVSVTSNLFFPIKLGQLLFGSFLGALRRANVDFRGESAAGAAQSYLSKPRVTAAYSQGSFRGALLISQFTGRQGRKKATVIGSTPELVLIRHVRYSSDVPHPDQRVGVTTLSLILSAITTSRQQHEAIGISPGWKFPFLLLPCAYCLILLNSPPSLGFFDRLLDRADHVETCSEYRRGLPVDDFLKPRIVFSILRKRGSAGERFGDVIRL